MPGNVALCKNTDSVTYWESKTGLSDINFDRRRDFFVVMVFLSFLGVWRYSGRVG